MRTHNARNPQRGRSVPKYPRLIFLDTNIVQNLHTFGEFIYDNALERAMDTKLSTAGPRIAEDVHALGEFIRLGQRAGWPLAVSSRTLRELEATTRLDKRVELVRWGGELADYFMSRFDQCLEGTTESLYRELTPFTFIQRLYLSSVLTNLPDENDRQLVIDALEYGCDIFLTMDYRTLWRYRVEVGRLGLQVMRPVEFMDYIRPWTGILS